MTQTHTMMLICTALVCLFLLAVVHALHEQTSVLARVAAASEATAAQTKPPISIEVSGFSPEAQQVFNEGVETMQKGEEVPYQCRSAVQASGTPMNNSYHFWAIKYVGPRGKQALYPAFFMNRADANKSRLEDYGPNDVVVEVWVREYGDES